MKNNILKPHVGPLSPGCRSCINGTWACVFLTMKCTRSCFFCPQDKYKMYPNKPSLDGIYFESPVDCIAFLKQFHFDGVGLSGGEPFFVFDTLLSYVKAIHSEFGKKMYIWTYTNGDLVTEDKLKQLAKEGLNELRFDIAASGYNLNALITAKKYISIVTVETPIIPEDKKTLSDALIKAKKNEVSFINLHELYCTQHNQVTFAKRKYNLTPHGTVSGSLQQGLELISKERKLNKPRSIQICTSQYKNNVHIRSINNRYLPKILAPYESSTERGFGRRVCFSISQKKQLSLVKDLDLNKINWSFDKKNKELCVQLKDTTPLLRSLSALPFTISYFTVSIQNTKNDIDQDSTRVYLTPSLSIDVKRIPIKAITYRDELLLNAFFQIFIQKKDMRIILHDLSSEHVGSVLKFYSQIKNLELFSI